MFFFLRRWALPGAVLFFAVAFYFLIGFLLPATMPSLSPGAFYRVDLVEMNWSFELPAGAVIIEKGDFLSEEVPFHLGFYDPVMKFHGFLEKWRIKDLEGFLADARQNTDLTLHEYRLRRTNGLVELFYFQTGREETFLGREFFLAVDEGSYVRWVFFLPAGLYQPLHEQIFARIVGSFRFSQSFLEVPGKEGPPADMAKEFPKNPADLSVPLPTGMFQPLTDRRLGDTEDFRHFNLRQTLPGQFNSFTVCGAPIVTEVTLYGKEGIS